MDRWLHAAIFVAVGSLVGLLQPMLLAGPGIFASVWGSSVTGDLLFVLGMVAAYLAARRTPGALAIPVALVATWATYAVAWSVTGPAMGFADEAGTQSPRWVLEWGWPGIVACGLWPWVQRRLEEKAEQAAVAPVPALDDLDGG